MDVLTLTGLVITLAVIAGLSVYTGSRVKKGQSKNSMLVVAGLLMGTLVGGSSTIGTSQLAYNYGLSAWWFTLGGGIACLILALVYTVPLRRSGSPTLVGMIRMEFGSTAGMLASVLSAVGMFINIISQIIACTAVIAVVFPNLGIALAAAFSALFMVLYVVFGGTKGAGIVGMIKLVLMYAAMMTCGIMVLREVGGFGSFIEMVRSMDNPQGVNFFSFFARGFGTDAGAALSLILGVLTTQTYAQAVLSGRTDRDGVVGALLSAFLIPPIGAGGILVGLYMRANAAVYAGVTAKTALTTFVLTHVPPLFAGVVLATLFIAAVGTGAGLALGIATVVNNDIVKRLTGRFNDPESLERLSRVWIIVSLALAFALSTGKLGDTILQFAFMSMGLRGAVVFMPLICALWLPGRVESRYAVISIVLGPLIVLVFGLLDVLPFDPLFAGIGVSAAVMLLPLLLKKAD